MDMTVEQLDRPPLLPIDDGVALLRAYLAGMAEIGFEKIRVDEWRNHLGDTIRHHYHAGTWELRITGTMAPQVTLRYSRDSNAYPAASTLIADTIAALEYRLPEQVTGKPAARNR